MEDKNVTRREFFSQVCSKDTIKGVMGAWYGFNKELAENSESGLSGDEAVSAIARRLRKKKNLSDLFTKGGIQ